LYIIKSKDHTPSSWSDFLEHFRSDDGSIAVEVEHELIKQIAESKNKKLLQRATEQLEWNDPESLRLLIMAWTTIMKEPKRAAEILLHWPEVASPPTLPSFRLVLTSLAKESNHILAVEILKLLCDKYPNLPVDRDCFHRVLHACSKQPQAAEETLLQMIQYAQKYGNLAMPNLTTYRLLFTAWSNSNQDGAGRRAYELLQSCPLEPDTVCCNLVLNAFANEGECELAQELLNYMLQTNCPKADRISVYTTFKAYAKANSIKATEQANFFLENLHATTHPSLKLPNARVYASVIGMYSRLGHADQALALIQELENKASQPNGRRFQADQICYQTVIGCLSKSNTNQKKNAQKAQELLECMALQFRLNLRTCNTVMKCWDRAKDPKSAHTKVLNKMEEWGVLPDIVSYNTVIQAYSRRGDVKRAETLLNHLLAPSSSVEPNSRTFSALLSGLAKQKTVEAAEQAETLLVQMKELQEERNLNTHTDLFIYNAVLNCWARQGNGPRAESFFRELERFGSPDLISYNSVINAYKDNFAKGESFVQEMIKRGILPDEITYRTLLKVMKADGSISEKKKKIAEMKRKYFSKI
jgi:pentatricopeptide repeat domain-containing protein 1